MEGEPSSPNSPLEGNQLDPSTLAVNRKLMRLSVDGRVNAKRSSILFDKTMPVPSENEIIFKEPLEETTIGRIKVKKLVSSESRFPRIEEMSHFHYNNVEIPGKLEITLFEDQTLEGNDSSEFVQIAISCGNTSWTVRRSYQDLIGLDRQLHRCIYDRNFSKLEYLGEIDRSRSIVIDTNMKERTIAYLERLNSIAGNNLNCGPILNWFELDNHGNHLVVMEADDSAINVPAIAAAHVIKRYVAQAPDEISLEVGEFVSVIDMPPGEETIWWRGKKGFEVGFFPSSCVDILIDKELDSQLIQHAIIQRPISKRRGKFISFLRYFFRSRPSKDELMQTGILRERTFGCDLGEHLASTGREIPLVLEMCCAVIEESGIVDGIYRLSGITSNMQRLRLAFDNEEPPDLSESRYLHDIHCISSLLKTYFRELPNPLLTYELYDKFMAAIRKDDDMDRTVAFHHAIQRLPPPHYRSLEYLLRHLEKCASQSSHTNMNEKNLAIVWAPNLLRPNVNEQAGAALLDIRHQAIIVEYLLKNVGIFFDKNLASAAIAFYPEADDVTIPVAENGYSKDIVLDRANLEKIGIGPPKLISLTEARARLKENNRICESEPNLDSAEKPRRKSRPPSNPTIPASIPISPGPSLLSLEEAQARNKVNGSGVMRRSSVDLLQIDSRTNKENLSEIASKKRSWKGLFSRNKSIGNDLDMYGDEKKAMSLSSFKRRVSYDVGDSSGLGTPRSQSSFNLRELGPSEGNTRPTQGKKGRKKKMEISSPLGIRTSSFVSYVGGMSQLERTSTAPEIDLRQSAKAARAKGQGKSKSASHSINTHSGESTELNSDKHTSDEFKPTLEVINDVSIEDARLSRIEDNAEKKPNKSNTVKKNESDRKNELDISEKNLAELDLLVVSCANARKDISAHSSPVDEKSIRNSVWIERYDEIARICSSAASVDDQDSKTRSENSLPIEKARCFSSSSVQSTDSISPRRRQASEIRDSILIRGGRELQLHGRFAYNVPGNTEKRSQSADIPDVTPIINKRASCLSDGGVPDCAAVDGVIAIDWVPVMQRSLTSVSDQTPNISKPVSTGNDNERSEKGNIARKQWVSRPFSSYDNHPLPQIDSSCDIVDHRKTKNRPSIYDNLLVLE
ncbi:GTPase-activating protein CdGAPr-like isoform X2 [Rhopilema esculentum]|eukprot:gene16629-8062_t